MWIFHVQAGQLNFEILTGQYTQIRHYSLRGSTSHTKRPFNINTKRQNRYMYEQTINKNSIDSLPFKKTTSM